ncbi:VeA-like protein [Sporothrix schenckii 1099-18]|nr:VeA-like protein [Sporothrix schenckii 1099-18]KJR89442.1 VeA-like protein [Sporothrix schenckii 1099-18]
MFVLNVDLWSEDALKEVNLVRHTTTTPSISSTTPASYEQVENTPTYSPLIQSDSRGPGYGSSMYGQSSANPYGQQLAYSQVAPPYMQQSNGYGQSAQYGGYHGGDYGMQLSSQAPGYGPPRVFGGPGDMMTQRLIQGNQPQGMFTRNLIGSLAASAFRLQDPADKIGIWFVLQDLSVRTEGNFRLRFSFVNVGPLGGSPTGTPGGQHVNTGKAPVLASCFSDVFTVYSAKKFPGVCESTVLSKTFATQGIKIPIRKEGIGKNGRGDDDDDYE